MPDPPPPPRETRSGKGGKGRHIGRRRRLRRSPRRSRNASADSVQALATALNDNITHQRELHTTLGKALTVLLDRPAPAPTQPMDHDAFAAALAPSLARAVERASGPKKIDTGRPGTEPLRTFSRPVFKPLPAAAEVKESEAFDINQFDPQLRRDDLAARALLPRTPHQRSRPSRGRSHRCSSRANLARPASGIHALRSMARRDCGHQRRQHT